MNREGLQESLSAVMDNEADELELRRVIANSAAPDQRAKWARYQVARAAMHRELLEPRLDLAAKVAAALEIEGTKLHKRPGFGLLGQLAVAASVTVAVLVGVRFYAGATDETAIHMAEKNSSPAVVHPVQEQAVLAGFSQEKELAEHDAAQSGVADELKDDDASAD